MSSDDSNSDNDAGHDGDDGDGHDDGCGDDDDHDDDDDDDDDARSQIDLHSRPYTMSSLLSPPSLPPCRSLSIIAATRGLQCILRGIYVLTLDMMDMSVGDGDGDVDGRMDVGVPATHAEDDDLAYYHF